MHGSSIWEQLKSYLRWIVWWIGPLRMTGSDVTGSDVSHVPCPELCSMHAQPEVAQYPPYWGKAGHAHNILPVRATSGQKPPLGRILRNLRLRMRRT